MRNQSICGNQPCEQRQINEVLRYQKQEVKFEDLSQSKCGDGVHAEGEDQTPVGGMIGQWIAFVDVPPRAEDEQERNPPCSRCPEEEGETFDVGNQIGEEGRVAFEEYVCACKSGDGDRTHVNPIGRREFLRINFEEHETIKDERDNQDIEHAAEHVEAQHGKKKSVFPRTEAGSNERAQHSQ